jgi:hypothetical protein
MLSTFLEILCASIGEALNEKTLLLNFMKTPPEREKVLTLSLKGLVLSEITQ